MAKKKELNRFLEMLEEPFLRYPEFDKAMIGYAEVVGNYIAIYDEEKCIDILVKRGMSFEEATDHFYYNVKGTYCGELTPVFITKF